MNPGNDLQPNMYSSDTYLNANETWHEPDGEWKADKVYSLLMGLGLHPQSICDIGCGTAAVLDHLGQVLGQSVALTGFEISQHAVRLAKAHHPNVTILQEDAETYRGQTFDLALVLDVVEHVEDYLGFMRSIRPLADIFIFHVPLDMAIQTVARMTPIMQSREAIGHLHYFSQETAQASIELAGYEILAHTLTTGSPDSRSSLFRKRAVDLLRSLTSKVVGEPNAARILGGFSLLVAARPLRLASDERAPDA